MLVLICGLDAEQELTGRGMAVGEAGWGLMGRLWRRRCAWTHGVSRWRVCHPVPVPWQEPIKSPTHRCSLTQWESKPDFSGEKRLEAFPTDAPAIRSS